MKKQYLLGFLLLLTSTIGMMPGSVFAVETIDLDGDGVPDSIDACPNLQEDYEGAIDGCPSNFVPWYDEDNDGIEDHLDQCENLKENYNKFQDEDGCPDTLPGSGDGGAAPDSDGDGFIDLVDLCTHQPETFNGILDRDGCPDSYGSGDRDRDGVADYLDECPLSSETYNRFQDGDGCPDSVDDFDFVDSELS
jgi:hypothetical protein